MRGLTGLLALAVVAISVIPADACGGNGFLGIRGRRAARAEAAYGYGYAGGCTNGACGPAAMCSGPQCAVPQAVPNHVQQAPPAKHNHHVPYTPAY